MSIELKAISLVTVFIVPLIAGIIPISLDKQDRVFAFVKGEAFAAGVFLGAGLIHMLGNALEFAKKANTKNETVLMFVGIAFLSMLLLEHVSRHFATNDKKFLPIIATLILCLHSLAEGVALGMANYDKTIMIVLIAILSHKWAAGFALAALLVKHLKKVWLPYLLFTIMTPLGIIIGHYLILDMNTQINVFAYAFAAGSFLYIGTLHGLKQAVMIDRCCDLKTFIWAIIGFIFMALID